MSKKKTIFSLIVLPLFLVSCGNDVGKEAELPSKGTAMEENAGKEKLKAALKKEMTPEENNDAFGFSVSNAHFSESVEGTISIGGSNVGTIESSIEAKDGNINFGIKGLTGTKADDLQATLSAGINIKGSSKVDGSMPASTLEGTSETTAPSSMTFDGNYSASANLYQNALYLDLSDKSTFSSVSSIIPSFNYVFPKSGKAKMALGLKDEDFPLLDTKDIEEFDKEYEEFYTSLPEGGEFKDHGKYGYSYSGTITKEQLEDEINDGDNDSSSTSVKYNLNNDCSASYALIFKETGFVSFGLEFNIGGSMNVDVKLNELTSYQMDMTASTSFGIKLSFLRGNDVKFPTINTEDYSDLQADLN